MNRTDKIFVAALHGTTFTLGWIFALACDVRVAAEGTYAIGLPESTRGVLTGPGGARRTLDALGVSRALELLLNGRALTPRDAANLGLVHYLVPAGDLDVRALEIAGRLASRPPRVIREPKRVAYRAPSFRAEAAAMLATMSGHRARRALTAFDRLLNEPAPSTAHALERAWRTARPDEARIR